jgi:autotransporter-associated beta strand protein
LFAAPSRLWPPGPLTSTYLIPPDGGTVILGAQEALLPAGLRARLAVWLDAATGVLPMAWSPLAGGLIFEPANPAAQRLAAAAAGMAGRYGGAALEQFAYAWILAHPSRPLPVIGTNKVERIRSAAQADTLTIESGNGVTEWRDVSTNGIAARPPGVQKPTVLSGELNGKPVIDFGTFGVSPYMHWYNSGGQVVLTNIRAVFWVLGSQNGGGFLLGGTTTAHFHRGNAPDGVFYPVKTSSRMWDHDWNTYPGGGRVEMYIDGIRRDQSAALNGGYQLISCMITTNVTAAGFATDRNTFSDRRGGQRLAEVIIYERALSEQERIETEEYLMAKWFGDTRWDADGQDPAVTQLDALGTRSLNAPDSGTTALGHLTGAGMLTKTGAGTLAVADAQDYMGTLALAGGGLALTAAAIPGAPATNAYFHVDASVTNAFVLDVDGRVLAWQDWRANGREAAVQSGFSTPVLVAGAAGGKPLVDFGALGSLQALSWNHTNTTIKAAFVVFQSLAATAQILGGVVNQAQDFYRGAGGQLYNTDATASRAVVYGANCVNGWRVEPMVATLPSGLCVISVIPTTDARASAFAMDRNNTVRSGGQRLAEVLIYNRSLTEQERRDTEAYLMYKWLGRAAPGYGAEDTPQIPVVSSAGAPLSVHVEGDGVASIGQLTGSGGVVKTGAGTLALGSGLYSFAGIVQVAEGTLAATATDGLAPASYPVFHVDASQTNTMTLVEENGTNFITRWRSLSAISNAAVERAGFNRPYLLTNDLAGVSAVGFGPFGTSGSCLKWETTLSTVRSVFMVLGSQEGGGFLLGAVGAANFHRGNYGGTFMPITKNNVMFGWDVSANVYNGATYLDGVRLADPRTRSLSGGYQLIEILTTDNTTADLFAGDRTFVDRVGGQRLAEVLVYDRALTERERLQTEQYLNRKWLGRATASAGLGTVEVADGGGLSADLVPMAVNRLVGEGTVLKRGQETLTLTDTTSFTGTVEVTAGTLNLAVPAAPVGTYSDAQMKQLRAVVNAVFN